MNEFLVFASSVILISASGVLSPGPLFAANVAYGLKENAKSGIKMANGHTLVELPLVFLLGIGVFSLENFPQFQSLVSIVGAIALFCFAGIQIRTTLKEKALGNFKSKQGAFYSGILLSGLNPFFLIWWATIGFKLISDAIQIWAFVGIFIMFGFHIWMDYVWMGSVAFFASKSAKFLSSKIFRLILLVLSGVLIYFGFTFLFEGLATI